MFQTVEWESKILRVGNERIVVLPRELVLEGEAIMIRQDEWGEITIYPTSPEGRKALDQFGPFADCDDGDKDKKGSCRPNRIILKEEDRELTCD